MAIAATPPGFEHYQQAIIERYAGVQHRYVHRDSESFEPTERIPESLFEDQMIEDWQPKSSPDDQKARYGASRRKAKRVEKYKLIEGLRKFAPEHVLLVGKPGSGKTTGLRRLLLDEVQSSSKLPVLIELRSFQTSIFDLVYVFTKTNGLELGVRALKQWLSQGQCLLLFDGLNELPSNAAQLELKQFLEIYHRCSVVATTRNISLGGDYGIERKLELQPLTTKQVQEFIRVYLPDESQAIAMLAQLAPRIKDFQETPLLLFMLCLVFGKYGEIPKNLGAAFRQLSEDYDSKIKQGIEKIKYCRSLLRYLAFKMLVGKDKLNPLLSVSKHDAVQWISELAAVEDTYIWAKDWLEFLLKHHLIQQRADGQIEFRHQLWQEYYAAEYLLSLLSSLEDEQLKCNFLNLLKWTEPIKLMLSLIEERGQMLRIIRLGLDVDLLLGARLVSAVNDLHKKKSIEYLLTYPLPVKWKHVGWRPWLLPSARSMLHLYLLERATSSSALFHVQGFLNSSYTNVRSRAVDALGKIGSEQAVSAITSVLSDKDLEVRLRAVDALSKIGSEQAVSAITSVLSDKHSFVRRKAANALGEIGSEQAVSDLISVLSDKDLEVRLRAVDALGKIGSEQAILALTSTLNKDLEVRLEAADALDKIGSEQAISALTSALSDKGLDVRLRAADALGRIGSEQAVLVLTSALNGKESDVRWRAARALSKIGSEQAISVLNSALKDKNIDVRWSAADALGKLGSRQAVSALATVLNNRDSTVRLRAADALGKIGGEQAVSALTSVLCDKDLDMRLRAADALGKIGSKQAVPALTSVLRNNNTDVRLRAADALGKIGGEQAVSALTSVLCDKDLDMRLRAASALGKIGNKQTVPALASALNDNHIEVRLRAADALGKIGGEQAINILWQVQLRAENLYEGENYTQPIETVHNQSQFYNYAVYHTENIQMPALPVYRIPPIVLYQDKSMGNHNISISGSNVNIDSNVNASQIGTQNNYVSDKELAKAAEVVQSLLHQIEQTHSTDMSVAVQEEIRTNPTFYERLYFMLQAGAIETLKTIFLPAGIPIAMVQGWIEAQPVAPPNKGLPPGGF